MDAYTPSGRFGRMPLLALIVAAPLIAAFSAAYSYLVVWIPIGGWITLIIMAAYVFACGFVTSLIGKAGHCRSPGAMLLTGFALGVFALYAAWVFFLKALLGQGGEGETASLTDIVAHPLESWQLIQAINENGWYTIKKMTPSGMVLWAFWAIEAAIVVGGVTLLSGSAIADQLYCEACSHWCKPTGTTWRALSQDQSAIPADQLDPSQLLALPAVEAIRAGPRRLKIDRLTCPACTLVSGLRFTRCSDKADDKGEVKTNEEVVCPIQLVTAEPAR